MKNFIEYSKKMINILIISSLFFGVINASMTDSKNETFNGNDRNNDTIKDMKEKVQQFVELSTSFLNNFPVNDVAILLSNVIYSEDDFEDLMHSTLESEIFAGILGYLKAYNEQENGLLWRELNRIFGEHPATEMANAAVEVFKKELKVLESLDVDLITKANLIFNSKVLDGAIKIYDLATKILVRDREFKRLLKHFADHRKPLADALFQFINEIKNNKILQDIGNLETLEILTNLVKKRRSVVHKFATIGKVSYAVHGQLPQDFVEKFVMELANELTDGLVALLDNEKFVDFVMYLNDGELPKRLKAAWQKASFEEKDSFIRDEL